MFFGAVGQVHAPARVGAAPGCRAPPVATHPACCGALRIAQPFNNCTCSSFFQRRFPSPVWWRTARLQNINSHSNLIHLPSPSQFELFAFFQVSLICSAFLVS